MSKQEANHCDQKPKPAYHVGNFGCERIMLSNPWRGQHAGPKVNQKHDEQRKTSRDSGEPPKPAPNKAGRFDTSKTEKNATHQCRQVSQPGPTRSEWGERMCCIEKPHAGKTA